MDRNGYDLVSEKDRLLPRRAACEDPRKRKIKKTNFGLGVVVATVLFLWWSIYAIPSLLSIGNDGNDDNERELSFDEIVPSEKLEWHPCYRDIGTYKCARLTVAMDYKRSLDASPENPKVHLALLLVPGVHTGSQQYSTSPLLINPGGPGNPGVISALTIGKMIQGVVGLDQDIIGFDPRGIGATTPSADCFSFPYNDETDEEDRVKGDYHRLLWSLGSREVGAVNSSNVALQKIDARARALSKLCQEKDLLRGDDSVFRHLSTPSVARDMLSIVDAWDEWTGKLSSEDRQVDDEDVEIEDSTSEPPYSLDTKGKLVYWGFSYGTLLGATFAAMFPDRVGRLVLDGVVDADHYVSPVWTGSLRDTDEVYKSFSRYCHQAEGKCALWRANDTITDIADRVDGIFADLKENPISVIDPDSKLPFIVSYSDVKLLFFVALYGPTESFNAVSQFLDLLDRGLHSFLSTLFRWPSQYELKAFCGPPPPPQYYPGEAQVSIICSDKRYILNETLPELETRFEQLANQSSFADIWMTLMIGCDGWPIKAIDPPMRWDDQPTHKSKPINTSFPVLFLSNTNDPVTPLHGAVKMSGKFTDSGLIEQRSEGHCSYAAVSKCTIAKIRAYYREGKVPPHPNKKEGKWDVCEADEWPFHPFESVAWAQEHGVEDQAVFEAMQSAKELQSVFYENTDFWGESSRLNLNHASEFFVSG